MATAPTRNPLELISYMDLYARWEKGNWSAMDLDFTEDREQWWHTFSDIERRAALWNYSLFFHGEDSVADNLSPYIDAAPREEQKYFLATQQVDEARHAVFFARFMREVCDMGQGDIASSLAATEPELTWGFRKVFAFLDEMADSLRKDRSLPNFARAITLYHVVVEASLAQPGQHFIEAYLTDRGLLPGFRAGMENVSKDEQRHIGFGVKMLSDLFKESDECRQAAGDLLKEVTPYTLGLFVPPNWDRRYTEVFGFTLEEIYAEGAQSLETKMRTAGLPLEDIPGLAHPIHLTPLERGAFALAIVQAGYMGEKVGPPSKAPEDVARLFGSVARSAVSNGEATTIQWEFTDLEPWWVRAEHGGAVAEQGRAPSPDVTLRVSFEDWVDLMAGRVDPLKLVATRRLRPKGGVRGLMKLRRTFPR
jgi:hypothetical protein